MAGNCDKLAAQVFFSQLLRIVPNSNILQLVAQYKDPQGRPLGGHDGQKKKRRKKRINNIIIYSTGNDSDTKN